MKLLILLALIITFVSCNVMVTEDGCILNKQTTSDGQSFYFGACGDLPTVQWESIDGTPLRAVRTKENKLVFYYKGESDWVQVGAKTPIVIDNMPQEP